MASSARYIVLARGRSSDARSNNIFFARNRITHYDLLHQVTPAASSSQPFILPRIAAGESRAMNDCIDRFGGLVWSIVKRSVSNTSDAEDLVQQIFTEVWKKASSYNPKTASETTFVALVARRRTIDHLRKTGRQPETEPIETADFETGAEVSSARENYDIEAVRTSLTTLPEETRNLFRLFFDQGFTHPEIAQKTGLPLGTVKTRLRRGLITLRDHLRRAELPLIQTTP